MRTTDFTRDIKWTKGEKATRAAFDAALTRKLAAIRNEVEAVLKRSAEPSQFGSLWKIASAPVLLNLTLSFTDPDTVF